MWAAKLAPSPPRCKVELAVRGLWAAKLAPSPLRCKVELAVPWVARRRSELFLPFAKPLDMCLANIEKGAWGPRATPGRSDFFFHLLYPGGGVGMRLKELAAKGARARHMRL